MKKYLIIDNNKQYKNTVIYAENKNDAISEGANRLKTFNVRCITTAEETTGTIDKFGFYIISEVIKRLERSLI